MSPAAFPQNRTTHPPLPPSWRPSTTLYDPSQHPPSLLLPQLVALLTTCIHAGALMQFLPPLDPTRLAAYWSASLDDPKRTVILSFAPGEAGRDAPPGRLIGTVVLYDIASDTGPFRAKVEKLMVEPGWRGHGVARALMERLEREGRRRGLTYLVSLLIPGVGNEKEGDALMVEG